MKTRVPGVRKEGGNSKKSAPLVGAMCSAPGNEPPPCIQLPIYALLPIRQTTGRLETESVCGGGCRRLMKKIAAN